MAKQSSSRTHFPKQTCTTSTLLLPLHCPFMRARASWDRKSRVVAAAAAADDDDGGGVD
jgi:hypothetical protein